MASTVKERHDALLVAIIHGIDDYVLNPPMDRVLQADEKLLLISSYVRVTAEGR